MTGVAEVKTLLFVKEKVATFPETVAVPTGFPLSKSVNWLISLVFPLPVTDTASWVKVTGKLLAVVN